MLSIAATTAVAGGFADAPSQTQIGFMITTGMLTAIGLTCSELVNKRWIPLHSGSTPVVQVKKKSTHRYRVDTNMSPEWPSSHFERRNETQRAS
jgi:hypothetical protein